MTMNRNKNIHEYTNVFYCYRNLRYFPRPPSPDLHHQSSVTRPPSPELRHQTSVTRPPSPDLRHQSSVTRAPSPCRPPIIPSVSLHCFISALAYLNTLLPLLPPPPASPPPPAGSQGTSASPLSPTPQAGEAGEGGGGGATSPQRLPGCGVPEGGGDG